MSPEPRDGATDRHPMWLRVVVLLARRPKLALCIWGALVLLGAWGTTHLEIDTTTSSFLDRSGSAWQAYQSSLDEFGGDEFLTIALEADSPFEPGVLNRVHELTSALEELPDVRRVDSVSSLPVVDARPDGSLELTPAMPGKLSAGGNDLESVIRKVAKDRILPGSLVSEDRRTFAINVVFDEDVDGRRDRAVELAERAVAGSRAWISGVPVFRTKVNSRTGEELGLFVPLTLGLAGAVIFLAFRSLWAVVVALGTAAPGALLALGLMGAMGVPLSLSTAVLPSILLALGCAYVMHVLTAVRGVEAQEPFERALADVARPVALSGLTTVVGFLAMSTVRVTAIQELATMGAVGVFAVLLATLTLAPALLRIRGLAAEPAGTQAWLQGVGATALIEFLARRSRAIVLLWCAGAGLFAIGLHYLRVETDIILWFPRGGEIRESYEAIRQRLSGITPMNVVIESKDSTPVTEPETLAAIDRLTAYLDGREDIGRAISVTDSLRQMDAGFAGRDAGRLPADRALAEQYLLLLESVEQIGDVISADRQRANVLLRVDVNGSRRLLEIGHAVDAWWAENGPAGLEARTTGIMYEFGRAEEEIAYGQIRGLALAFGVIGIVLLAMLRRPVAALAALVPNVLPLMMTYGLMGLAGIALDAATVCLGSIALGIAVDDTIHIVSGFQDVHDRGGSSREALTWTFRRVLPALIFSTVAIVVGFLVLAFSEFTLVRNFGLVTAGMVGVCLVADLTLLPVLLAWLFQRRGAPAAALGATPRSC